MFNHIDLNLPSLERETIDGVRYYKVPNNEDLIRLVSITSVTSHFNKEIFVKWRKKVGEEEANRISTQASRRGTAVHEIIEKYIDNVEDFKDGYTPDVIQSFLDLKPILDSRIGKVFAQEAPLYSTYLGVAGRVDCVCEFDGKPAIVDFKTSRKKKYPSMIKNYFMQEAGYAVMWEERTGQPITQLVTIIAVDNEDPQIFVEHRDNWVNQLKDVINQYNEENSSVTLL